MTHQFYVLSIGYALRAGARGVVICVCEEGDCAYRLGDRWTVQRILAEREPKLRRSVPRERLRVVAAGRGQESRLRTSVKQLTEKPLLVKQTLVREPGR